MNPGVALLLTLPAPFALAVVWRRVSQVRQVSGRLVIGVFVAGALAGAVATLVTRLVLQWLGVSLTIEGSATTAALGMFLLAAPLAEAAKVAVVWPLYLSGRVLGSRAGLLYGVAAGAGFALAAAPLGAASLELRALSVAMVLLAVPVQLFSSGLWGYWLGRGPGGRWFGVAWLLAVVLHGTYVLLIASGSPKLVAAALPMTLTMGAAGALALRDLTGSDAPRSQLLRVLPEPPSLRAMRQALGRRERPLLLHWIGIGGLVTLGLMLVNVAVAVWLGHRLGVDFTLAESAGSEAGGPLALLGSAVLLAFPLGGFLVARASGAESVLEPALGACIALVLLALTLAVSTPLGVLISVGLAPVAFLLACVGAWFGVGGE